MNFVKLCGMTDFGLTDLQIRAQYTESIHIELYITYAFTLIL